MSTLADLSWLTADANRCPDCFLHVVQGHREPCVPSGPLGLLLARQARDTGMARTVQAHPDAVSLIDAAIMRRVEAGEVFSANTIRAELTSLTPDERPAIGARMRELGRRHCTPVGEEPSTDVGTHGKKVTRWQPKGARRAVAA